MPHSSGGGSHGGGFHGGGSHGGHSGNRISNHYFYGARRYRKHHRRTGTDEYVYASSMPRKAGLSSIIIIAVIGVFFFGIIGAGTWSELPKKLNSSVYYEPAVHDDIDIINNDDALKATLTEYYGATGICPVIYTVYDEDWSSVNPELTETYEDLETYAYFKYVNNFADEQHFVIVYSLPKNDAELFKSGELAVPNYQWEACQGDETDPILTESMFRVFGNKVQKDLEAGQDPGVAFENAFRFAIGDAESRLKPLSLSNIISRARSIFPLLVVAAIIIPMLVISIKQYVKDRDAEYYEVPLENGDKSARPGYSAGSYAYNGSSTVISGSDSKVRTVSIVGLIIGLVFMIPFVITGLGTLVMGIVMSASGADNTAGGFLIIFGIVWTLIVGVMLFGIIRTMIRKTKQGNEVQSGGYPRSESGNGPRPNVTYCSETGEEITDPDAIPATPLYSDPASTSEYSEPEPSDPFDIPLEDINPFVPLSENPSPFVPLKEEPEFDPQFFNSPKSSIEDDDEDYKRMKRRGFE